MIATLEGPYAITQCQISAYVPAPCTLLQLGEHRLNNFPAENERNRENASRICCSYSSFGLGSDRHISKTVFQHSGFVVVPCHINPIKFHAPITIFMEGLLNKVGSMLNSDITC
jgi:hypothetical protein